MPWVIIFIVCLAVFFFFLYRYIKAKNLKEKIIHNNEAKAEKANAEKSESEKAQNEITEKLIQMITSDFNKLGWDEWDESIHRADGQLVRLRRAVEAQENGEIKIVRFSADGYSKVIGTNNDYYLLNKHRCSCPDFRDRHLPCKHMYFVAVSSSEYEKYLFEQVSKPSEYCLDNTLYGLRFSISGKGQEKVRQFIVSHAGTFGNDLWRTTSAVVSADGINTGRIYEALSKEIEVLSFDDLKLIVKEWGGVDVE